MNIFFLKSLFLSATPHTGKQFQEGNAASRVRAAQAWAGAALPLSFRTSNIGDTYSQYVNDVMQQLRLDPLWIWAAADQRPSSLKAWKFVPGTDDSTLLDFFSDSEADEALTNSLACPSVEGPSFLDSYAGSPEDMTDDEVIHAFACW